MNLHPLFQIDLDSWNVTNYSIGVEIKNKNTGKSFWIPLPEKPQTKEWWRERVKELIN